VRTHDVHSKILNNNRKVLVWLPPGYEKDSSRRYPVLYMHDGQNLFDDATSFAGEWRADETAQQLVEQGKIEPIIIVGIENTWQRVLEYTPTVDAGEGGRGQQYARFVVEEVKPLIDQTYRTKPDAANTAVGGSSLGGLISIYMVQKHGDVFGRCAAVSPSLWWGNGKYLADMTRDMSFAKGKRIWLDMGTSENADPALSRENVQHCETFANALRVAGLTTDKDYAWRAYDGAAHNETAWADRFDDVLIFLFGRH
jgi:predicted alpha/beta superfamily hydrolase